MPVWLAIVITLVGATAFYVAVARIVRWVMSLAFHRVAFSDLAIRMIPDESMRTSPEATLKIAHAGNNPLIVEAVSIRSRLSTLQRVDRLLAWPQLIRGYFADDIEGLQTVLGTMYPTSTWIPAWPVHKIENSYVRKAVSYSFGLYMLWFSLNPVTWLFVLTGPYVRFQLVASDEAIQIKDANGNNQITPFLLTPHLDQYFHISYQLSLKAQGFSAETPWKYIQEVPKRALFRLPRRNEFVWRAEELLLVRVRGKWRKYPISLGTGLVCIGDPGESHAKTETE